MESLRTVLHVDMDAFFVSVELRRRPELRGRPVVVGGTGRRGVVAAASYEARRYGVHSALSSARARRLCPAAVFLPGDHSLYAAVSDEVIEILERFTPLVEPLSLDEAFLDVTGSRSLFGDGRRIGESIRTTVRDELDLTCSVGVAPNKFLAKLASVEAKPRIVDDRIDPGAGVVVVEPGHELEFLHPLAVARLWGVGPVTRERLDRIGVATVADLAAVDPAILEHAIGRAAAHHLAALAAGVDDRPVESGRHAKSIGHEQTFPDDLHQLTEIRRQLVRLADAVAARLRERNAPARTTSLKVRFGDFSTITRSVTGDRPVRTAAAILERVDGLLAEPDLRRRIGDRGVRLLGISCSGFASDAIQLGLFDESADRDLAAAETVDRIRQRFGDRSIGLAGAVGSGGLLTVRRGAQQWGPDAEPESSAERGRMDRHPR